jgi:polar amino acid transport system permease protein
MEFGKKAKAKAPLPLAEAEQELLRIPGAEPSARIDAWWWLVVLVVALVTVLAIFIPDPYADIFRYVLDGIWITIYITILSFIFILVAGLVGALGRISKNRVIYGIATLYVEIIRGIPLMVQLIWWYFAFPAIVRNFGQARDIANLANYTANPNIMAVAGLTICYGAYMAEIYRAGIQSIGPGQMEAARSLGMNYFQAMRYVILPQAVRVVLPPVGNEFTALLKDSSLVSVVAVTDLTRAGREFMATHLNPIETWTMIALLYLIMTLISARVASWIEKKVRSGGRES